MSPDPAHPSREPDPADPSRASSPPRRRRRSRPPMSEAEIHGLRVALWCGEDVVDRLVAGDVPELLRNLGGLDLQCLAVWLLYEHAPGRATPENEGAWSSSAELGAMARRKRGRNRGSLLTEGVLPRRYDTVLGGER